MVYSQARCDVGRDHNVMVVEMIVYEALLVTSVRIALRRPFQEPGKAEAECQADVRISLATMFYSTALVDVVITMDRPAFDALEKTSWGIMPTDFHPHLPGVSVGAPGRLEASKAVVRVDGIVYDTPSIDVVGQVSRIPNDHDEGDPYVRGD